IGLAIEILNQTSLPCRRQIKTGDQTVEQRDITDDDIRSVDAIVGRRLQSERKHFSIGCRLVGSPERFNACLQEFARGVAAVAEDRSQIAVTSRLSRKR